VKREGRAPKAQGSRHWRRRGAWGVGRDCPPPTVRGVWVAGVATGGHVPTLPRPEWVVRFAQIQRVFWRSRSGGDSRLCMSLKVHRSLYLLLNTSRKCVCPLQIVYAYLASGGFVPDSNWGSAPRPCWRLPSPKRSVPSKPWLC